MTTTTSTFKAAQRTPRLRAWTLGLLLAAGTSFGQARECRADMLNFNINFGNTSALGSNFSLDFQLANSNALNTTNLTIQNFMGSVTPAPGSTFTLSDSTANSELITPFASAATNPAPFSFDILANFTPNAASPDQLVFFFANNADPSGASDTTNLFSITFNSGNPNSVGRASFASTNPNVPAPTITVTAVPEPETWFMMALGLSFICAMFQRRKARREPLRVVFPC